MANRASAVNQFVEYAVRAGVGAPCKLGSGLVIVETKGRKSGKPRNVPVLAQRFGDTLFISTVREQSQWMRNLEADADPRVVIDRKSTPVSVRVKRVGTWTVFRLRIREQVQP